MGFSQTSTPFESVSTVTPMLSSVLRETTWPEAGFTGISSARDVADFHGSTVAAAASVSTWRSAASAGSGAAALSGAATRTARLSSASRSRATSLTSSWVIPGSSARVRSYSVWMPGNGSSVVKFRMYSAA